MADGTWRLSGEDRSVYEAAGPDLPASSKAGELLDLVSGRSAEWMRAALSLLDMNIDCRGSLPMIRDAVKEHARCGSDVVDDAFDEIKRRGLLRSDRVI